jgi:hypothetical protein
MYNRKIKSVHKEVKYPENLLHKKNLQRGDYSEIAKISDYSAKSLSEVFNGRRRMTDKVKMAYLKILKNREKLESDFTTKVL